MREPVQGGTDYKKRFLPFLALAAFLALLTASGCQRSKQPKPASNPPIVAADMLPPDPPKRALATFVVPPPKHWFLVFSNPNPSQVTWTVETKPLPNGSWIVFAQSNHVGPGEVWTQFWPTQGQSFFRVGFQ